MKEECLYTIINQQSGNIQVFLFTDNRRFDHPQRNELIGKIIIEAKSKLYITSKPIKKIAWYLGYSDEFHFRRLFKNDTDISLQIYRDTVGFGKAE